jgi:hypothetical protein
LVLGRLDQVRGGNIGIATGGRSGLIGIDIDGEVGEQTWAALVASAGEGEPLTLTAVSGRDGGGRHLYFAISPDAPPLRSGNDGLGPGIDVKYDNGYLVCPPSVHPTGRAYAWVDETMPVAPLPTFLLEQLTRQDANARSPGTPSPSPVSVDRLELRSTSAADTPWGLKAIKEIASDLADCPAGGGPLGGRDNLANWSYFRAGQIVAGGNLSDETAIAALNAAMDINGLGSGQAKHHAFEAGQLQPDGPKTAQPDDGDPEAPAESSAPEVATGATASELVSTTPLLRRETYSDVSAPLTPTSTWLAGVAPDEWCKTDGLYALIATLDLGRCIFRARIVLKHKTKPHFLDTAGRCKERQCAYCHLTKLRTDLQRVSKLLDRGVVRPFMAIVPSAKWDAFRKRQDRRNGKVQYVRIPLGEELLVLGCSATHWEPDWVATDGPTALLDVWAWTWIRLEPAPNQKVTFSKGWARPEPNRTGEYERMGITFNIGPFRKAVKDAGGKVFHTGKDRAESTFSVDALESSVADAIEATVRTEPPRSSWTFPEACTPAENSRADDELP